MRRKSYLQTHLKISTIMTIYIVEFGKKRETVGKSSAGFGIISQSQKRISKPADTDVAAKCLNHESN